MVGVVKPARLVYNGAMNNYAFIDGQNLRIGTAGSHVPWRVDLYKFRRYLREKYNVVKAYYFIGYMDKKYRRLYEAIKRAGFELVFRVCMKDAYSSKKGNVDTDIVFAMMRDFHEHVGLDKLYLVSGDSDYYKTILYLRNKGKLGKIIFPARESASLLYRQIGAEYFDYLDKPEIRRKIESTNK